jgi:hypothetical protein
VHSKRRRATALGRDNKITIQHIPSRSSGNAFSTRIWPRRSDRIGCRTPQASFFCLCWPTIRCRATPPILAFLMLSIPDNAETYHIEQEVAYGEPAPEKGRATLLWPSYSLSYVIPCSRFLILSLYRWVLFPLDPLWPLKSKRQELPPCSSPHHLATSA